MTWALTAWQFAKRVPWQAYAIVALVLAVWIYGNNRYAAGRESVLEELRAKEAEAKEQAWEAIEQEGIKGAERAKAFEAQQETLRDAIKEAEAAETSALDELF